ncbi:MAG: hypothetical protein ACR2FK_00520 [Sphingomicrobium sp.]
MSAMLLLGCGKADPVADNAVAPSDAVLDKSTDGLAAPANAAAAERAQQAATPLADDGMRWTIRATDRAALYGPAGAAAAFAIQCRIGSGGQRLWFLRYLPASGDIGATMSFTGNGSASSLPSTPIADPAGPGGHWQAIAETGDMGRAVARTFAGPAGVNVSVGGGPSLVVPPSAVAQKVMADCLG